MRLPHGGGSRREQLCGGRFLDREGRATWCDRALKTSTVWRNLFAAGFLSVTSNPTNPSTPTALLHPQILRIIPFSRLFLFSHLSCELPGCTHLSLCCQVRKSSDLSVEILRFSKILEFSGFMKFPVRSPSCRPFKEIYLNFT